MTDTVVRKLEVAAYIVAIITGLVVTAVTVRNYIGTRPRSTPPKLAHLSIPGTDWRSNRHTLVLAMSVDCHFCRDSADFYKRLTTDEQVTNKVHVVAVVPETAEEGRAFVKALGVRISK